MDLSSRFSVYLESLDTGNTPLLDTIEQEAREGGVPVIRKETQRFLRTLLAMKKPTAVLEVGTAIGFSSLLMCTFSDAHITTIENYAPRIPIARKNFERAGFADRIPLLEGDAAEILPGLTGPYGLIFLDAAKGQYLHFLPELVRLLPPGGVLLADNCLQEGAVLDPHWAAERRDRTIWKRMREFLFELTHSEQLETSILPVGDGLALSVRRETT